MVHMNAPSSTPETESAKTKTATAATNLVSLVLDPENLPIAQAGFSSVNNTTSDHTCLGARRSQVLLTQSDASLVVSSTLSCSQLHSWRSRLQLHRLALNLSVSMPVVFLIVPTSSSTSSMSSAPLSRTIIGNLVPYTRRLYIRFLDRCTWQ